MSKASQRRPRRRAAAAAALLAGLVLSSCNDSTVCVFTTGCQGGPPGGIAGNPAALPENGEWIDDDRPEVVDVFPPASTVARTTPIVITFTESMQASTLQGAFELIPFTGGFPGPPVPGIAQALLGDGRMLVLLPTVLTPTTYQLQLADDAEITDITGQVLTGVAVDEILTTFTVEMTDPATPRVVATWPPDGGANESDVTELVVVFDRPMDPATVDDDSFVVTVNGADPPADPEAMPFAVTVGGVPVPDNRVYLYQSADADGVPQSLGANADVDVSLSPAGAEIAALSDGALLDPFDFSFMTADVLTPLSAAVLSMPNDAIGTPNLTAGDPEELTVEVSLLDGMPGDVLELYLFGTSTDEMDPQLFALKRQLTLSGPAPIVTATFDLETLDLLLSSSPIQPRFADGPVAFAFRLRRGIVYSPLRVLDADPAADGIQDVELDTTAPTILELLVPGGDPSSFRSDLPDVTIAGFADEEVFSLEVSTGVGDNGTLPPVIGSNESGLFIAAPVDVGLVPGAETAYTLVAYDRALNQSDPIMGTFRQLGVVGGGVLTPGDTFEVEVYDAETLLPIEDALVMTHEDVGDDATFPLLDFDVTGSTGLVTVASAMAPSVGTLVTVDADGYDLLTFHGVTTNRFAVPLRRTGFGANASVAGDVTTSNGLAILSLPFLQDVMSDTRRDAADRFYPVAACVPGPGGLTCSFGPEPILTNRLGAQSYLAGNFMVAQPVFSPLAVLGAFDLRLPLPPVAPGSIDMTEISVDFVFSDPTVDPTELPIEIDPVSIVAVATMGIDLGSLDGDPTTVGDPRVSVEAIVPGVPGSLPVGRGLAYSAGANVWSARSVIPGAVAPGGFFGSSGIVDTDLFIRVELRDTLGNRSGQRPRRSTLPMLPIPSTLLPANVPVLLSPMPGGASSGASYNLAFTNAIVDFQAVNGLYRASLTDSVGRGWQLWRLDRPDATGAALIHVPDVAAAGGVPLAAGTIECRLSSFGWPTLNPVSFQWSDVEREHDVFSHSMAFSFTQP